MLRTYRKKKKGRRKLGDTLGTEGWLVGFSNRENFAIDRKRVKLFQVITFKFKVKEVSED